MSVSYPLSMPANIPNSISMRMVDKVGLAEGEFGFEQQVQDWIGGRWEADIAYPRMKRLDAEAIISFLGKLRGRFGTLLLPPYTATSPRGSIGGTITFASGAVRTYSVTLSGGTGSWKAGDFLQINHTDNVRLYKVLNDAAASDALDIWPALRAPVPSVGAGATYNNPLGTFRLLDNKRQWDVNEAQVYGIRFSVVEAL